MARSVRDGSWQTVRSGQPHRGPRGRIANMSRWAVGILAAAVLFAAATPTAAQTRPRVSGAESSRSTGPTCVISGVASDCAGSAAPGGMSLVPSLVVVGPLPVVGSVPGVLPGAAQGGRAGSDTDVDRSTHHGIAVER